MERHSKSRRRFLKSAGLAAGASVLAPLVSVAEPLFTHPSGASAPQNASPPADYTLHIKAAPVEIAPNRIISTITYNGQFPGPLLRFREGRRVTVDVFNDTETPEQLHWHGQKVPVDVDGAAEEGTPFVPAHGSRRISFTPNPAGFRFYHSHNRAGANMAAGTY
ncbi:MAG TPA: multicopper oxidase domain-containing protein, partial [Candidatus Acidoferrales bacterium]|nr:multicopper oxidase domain-containing protein [Candidatus Acidoferrales bacterium]